MTLVGESLDALASVYRNPGPYSCVYLDVSGDVSDPGRTQELRNRTVLDRLRELGAPDSDVAAIDRVLQEVTGVAGGVSRLVASENGELRVDELIIGPRVDDEVATFGPVPDLTPLVEHRPEDFHYLVIEVSRDGGELRLYSTRDAVPLQHDDIAGDTDSLHKVQVGGWSQARYQRHTEEVWKHNQSEIADAVEQVVTQYHPRVIVLAGDVRARQLLAERLGAGSRGILSMVPTETRAGGASDAALTEHLEHRLRELGEQDRDAILGRILDQGGKDGAHGIGEVVAALRQGQVDVMLLDFDGARGRTLLALDAEPWVATAPEDALDTKVLDTVPATVALLRAAALTGVRVLRAPSEDLPGAELVAALLRWPIGPSD